MMNLSIDKKIYSFFFFSLFKQLRNIQSYCGIFRYLYKYIIYKQNIIIKGLSSYTDINDVIKQFNIGLLLNESI